MGADYDVDSRKDDALVPEHDINETMVIEDEDGEDSSLLHMYGASFTLPFAKQVNKTASEAIKESSTVLSAEGKETLKTKCQRFCQKCIECY